MRRLRKLMAVSPVEFIFAAIIFCGGGLSSFAQSDAPRENSTESSVRQSPTQQKLSYVRRIFVDHLGDDSTARQVQSMLVASLVESGRFQITENRDSADAIIKGIATEISSKDFHASSESSVGAVGVATFEAEGNSHQGSATGAATRIATGNSESSAFTETTYFARLSVRLVSPSGDVLWATTQESQESRTRPISSDLATKVTRILMRAIDNENRASHGNNAPKAILISVKGDKAMESEISAKLISWGGLQIVQSLGEADVTLEVTQTGKYNGWTGTGVTAAAILKDNYTGQSLWSTTKGGSWSMSGFSTRKVARQIADELIKFVQAQK